MASLIDKIKHKINPKTEDIKNLTAQTIGSYVKDIQEQSESLAKKARKIKQMIKSDVEITEDKAKQLANKLFAENTSGFANLTQLYISFRNISKDLGLKKTTEKIEKVEEFNQKIPSVAKSEKPEPPTYGLRDEALNNYVDPEQLVKRTALQNSPVANRTRSATGPDKPSSKSYTNAADTSKGNIEFDILSFIKNKNKNQKEFGNFIKKLNNWLKNSNINVELPELTNSNVNEYFRKLSDPLKKAIAAINNKKKVPMDDAIKFLNNVSKSFEWLNNLDAIVGPETNSFGMLKSLGFGKSFDYKYVYFNDDKLDTEFRNYLTDDSNKLNVFEKDLDFTGKYNITDKKENPTAWYYSNNNTDKKVKEFLNKHNNYIIFE